ncbi:MAG: hypothetical protein HWN79_13660 [Candidatus Lokiarchaeota archaeon]|nr:hypothetical protein [Candidatus Lokiarchaeota archaeon]
MVLFQPTESTVWDFGYYFGSGKVMEIVFWIVAIIGIIFALFLLADYLNNRKPAHFYWGISFALIWINTHVVIFSGTFATFLDPVPSVVAALTVGLFAVGVFKSVKPEHKLGNYLVYFVLIMSLVIGTLKVPFWDPNADNIVLSTIIPIVVMVLHVPSALIIVWLPFTTRGENGKAAVVLSLAGILMGLVGLLLALTTIVGGFFASDLWLEIIFNVFPFVYLGAGLCFAWGTFVPKQWSFNIPGIELE